MVTMTVDGDFSKTTKFLQKLLSLFKRSAFDKYGERGVEALRSTTPTDTGRTADAWYYEIDWRGSGVEIIFCNSNINEGFSVAIGLQYGHGTGTGGYVSGRDYLDPAIQPVFDEMADDLWKEVLRA